MQATSYGHSLVGIANDCMPMRLQGGGFKQVRLDQKGLHAVLIPIGDLTKHDENIHYKMRHILPQEVAC